MSTQSIILAAIILGLGATQYLLMLAAIRDLRWRPRVRGDNKVLWGLVILCVPFAGAMIYSWMGPTSFLRRPALSSVPTPMPRYEELQHGASVSPLTRIDGPPQAQPATFSTAERITSLRARATARPLHGVSTLRRTGS